MQRDLCVSEWLLRKLAHEGAVLLDRAPMLFDWADLQMWIEREKVRKKRMGRPPKRKSERRSRTVRRRAEYRKLLEKAKRMGLTVSEFRRAKELFLFLHS